MSVSAAGPFFYFEAHKRLTIIDLKLVKNPFKNTMGCLLTAGNFAEKFFVKGWDKFKRLLKYLQQLENQ